MSSRLVVALLMMLALIATACSGPDTADDPARPTTSSSMTPIAVQDPTATPTTTPTHMLTATATLPMPTSTPMPTATATTEPTAAPTQPAPTATPTQVPPTSTPPPSANVVTIRTADTTEKIVALTFDAGADRGFAAEILNTLRDEGVVATFGMTGHWAADNPDLIQRMVDEGHQLMNHTMTHRSWTGLSTGAAPLTSAERAAELRETEEIIRDIVGYELQPYFRPPYGDYDDSVVVDLRANGYTVNVMWTVDSLGWRGLSAGEITDRVVSGTVPGAIHLFHVGAQSQDAAALSAIIHALRDQGYRFVTIEEMVGR